MNSGEKKKIGVSVVIPCWNGKELLEKNLSAIMELEVDEVVVVDDASTDGSAEFISQSFPQIKLIRHQENLGFGQSCNDGVKVAKGEVIVLLNQDVLPTKDLLSFVLPHFKNEKMFAVSFKEKQWSWGRLVWQNGFIKHSPGGKTDQAHLSGWANGGSAAFSKSVWEILGGFDQLYSPFYWEDIDLGYRAWKLGYRVIWEPKAIVEHYHGSSISSSFSKDYISFISSRNQLIFIWKNITSFKLLSSHCLFLGKKILKNPGYLKVFLAAFSKAPQIFLKWCKEKLNEKISDEKLFQLFSD